MPVLVCILPGYIRALQVVLRLYFIDFHITWLKFHFSSHEFSCKLG